MSVNFGSLIMTNTTGIPMTLTVEAPPGTRVIGPTLINPNTTAPFVPAVDNATTARIVADFGRDHGTAEQTVTVTGTPAGIYLQTVVASARILTVTILDVVASHQAPPVQARKKTRGAIVVKA